MTSSVQQRDARGLFLKVPRPERPTLQPNKPEPWTEIETDYLRAQWGVISARIIGRDLGRTKDAVIGRAHRLKLRKLDSKAPNLRQPAREEPMSEPFSLPPSPPPPIDYSKRWRPFTTLRVRDCRWPQDAADLSKPAVAFCCARAPVGSPYCQEHRALAFGRQAPAWAK
jgi:GcrA cell cycle regulator